MKDQSKEMIAAGTADNGISRRRFLNYAGFAGAGLLIAACNKNDNSEPVTATGTVDFGSGDKGLLNYAFAIEQLQAAFYTRVCTTFPAGLSVEQQQSLMEIRDHQIAHRELLRNAVMANSIGDLSINLDSINFADMQSVLVTAAQFEDIAVSAYLGIVPMFTTADYMLTVMKMASVEGRHDSYIRSQIDENSYTFGVDSNSADVALLPDDIVSKIAPYFRATFSTRHLPKS